MPKTKKTLLPLDLIGYDVYEEDTSVTSKYFQISNLPSVFTGGKNSFLLGGSAYLKPGSEILIEILDSEGNPIYQTAVDKYTEGNSKLISIEIYDTTPSGFCTLILMGKATVTSEGNEIPETWKDTYNVRWMKRILVDYDVNNISPLKFLNEPQITVIENKFNNILSASYDTNVINFTSSLTPLLFSGVQIGYGIEAMSPSTFSSDHYNAIFTGSLTINSTTVPINLTITDILNSTKAFTKGYLIDSPINNGYITKLYLASGSYTTDIVGNTYGVTSSAKLQYSVLVEPTTNTPKSYANIRVSNLNTVSGELYKVRVYNKVATNPADFKLVADVLVVTEELLVTSSNSGLLPIGNLYRTTNINDNWYAGSLVGNTGIKTAIYPVSGSIRYYVPTDSTGQLSIYSNNNVLLSSLYADVPVNLSTNKFDGQISQSGYFIGTKQFVTLFPTTEYTLTIDAYYKSTSESINLSGNIPKVDIYLIGSGSNKIISDNPLGQLIGNLTVAGSTQRYQQQQFNFSPAIKGGGMIGLRFVVSNGFWNFSNISLKPATETQFSPDEVQILIPNNDYYNQLLQYKVEFFDINSNSANISATSTPTFFSGSVIDLGILP